MAVSKREMKDQLRGKYRHMSRMKSEYKPTAEDNGRRRTAAVEFLNKWSEGLNSWTTIKHIIQSFNSSSAPTSQRSINSGPLGGAVAVCRAEYWLQSAIETDEMWLQLQTDLKEAIESVWTVMGYPEHCRGARCNNEMHLFVSPPLSFLRR